MLSKFMKIAGEHLGKVAVHAGKRPDPAAGGRAAPSITIRQAHGAPGGAWSGEWPHRLKSDLALVHPPTRPSVLGSKLAAALLAAAAGVGSLQAQDSNAAPAKPEKPPPLPLHQIEGNGGIFSTLSAYVVNPPRNGEPVGRPSIGFSYVNLGHGQNLEALTITESPRNRLELGYGYNNFELGDLPKAVAALPGSPQINGAVNLHNFNARLQALKEGEFGQKWLPALTAGVHYKRNDGISQINNQLGGALRGLGIEDNDGVDVTLYASKLVGGLPRPVLFNVGGRASRGAWDGLGGFTGNYSFTFEGSVVVFLTDRLVLAAEYRQQPNDYTAIPLIRKSGDWWTLDAAYVVSKHFTVAAGYGHFGGVLNHEANGVWGITTKFEF